MKPSFLSEPHASIQQQVLAINVKDMNGLNWGSGLLLHAFIDRYLAGGTVDFIKRAEALIESEFQLSDACHDPDGSMWKLGAVYAAQCLQTIHGHRRYDVFIDQCIDYYASLPLTPHNIKASKWDKPELWVDSLMTVCPSFCAVGVARQDERLIAQAFGLLESYQALLVDKDSHLWFHAYDDARRQPLGQRWCRGNAWALLAMVSLLEQLPRNHKYVVRIHDMLIPFIEVLLQCQGSDGQWRTLLNRSESHSELSGHCLIAAFMQRLLRLNLIPYDSRIEDAFQLALPAFELHITAEGKLSGVSVGTGIGTEAYYNERTVTDWPLWGSAAALFLSTEICLLRQRHPPQPPAIR